MKINIDFLKAEIVKRNLTQSELAKGAGIRQAAISNALNGKTGLQSQTINKISKYLEIEPSKLIQMEG